jgi:uncharacterized protein DUF4331
MGSLRRLFVAIAALTLVLAVGAGPSFASSHREAPLTAADPQIDSTDLYAFVSPDAPDTVTLIGAWIPFESPAGGPNFYPWATGVHYDVRIDNNGDAKPDLAYRWEFTNHYRNPKTFLTNTGPVKNLTDSTLNFYQTYTLTRIDVATGKREALVTDAVAAPSNVGAASMPDYAALRRQAIVEFNDGSSKSFVGQSDDPFFLDLRVFDLLYGTNLKEAGDDTLDGYNVNVMALQVPKSALAAGGDPARNPIVGVWTTAERQSVRTQASNGTNKTSGPWVQVSRLGQPLVNEVVAPVGAKDLFSGSKPQNDGQFLAAVQDPEVPKLIESIYKIDAPATPRKDLVEVFLTGVKGLNQPAVVVPSEQLRLNMSIAPSDPPNRLGVIGGDKAGFPNGRRLTDDVVDIALRVMEGELLGTKTKLGDGVDHNDIAFDSAFPYVAMPHSGSVVETSAGGGGREVITRSRGVSTPVAGAIAGSALALGALIVGLIAWLRRRRQQEQDEVIVAKDGHGRTSRVPARRGS